MKLNKKTLHRVAATMLATAMLACTALTGVAAEGGETTAGPTLPVATTNTSISWKTKLDMSDAPKAVVPDVTVTYTVAPVTDGIEGAIISQETSTAPRIYEGVALKKAPASVVFSSTDELPESVTVVEKETKIDFTDDDGRLIFGHPGIFRYEVTNNWNAYLGKEAFEGVNEPGAKRHLDVYVVLDVRTQTLKVANAVLTSSYAAPQNGSDKNNVTYTGKLDDYVVNYKTGGFTVKEHIEGPMGNKTDKFDYKFTFKNEDFANQTINVIVNSVKTQLKFDEEGNAAIVDKQLTDGDSITIEGLPMGTEYEIIEKVPTESGYDAKYTINGSITDKTPLSGDGADKNVPGNQKVANPNTVIDIYNSRDAINPTGVLTDIAPYAAMVLVAAAAGVVFSRRRREQD